VFGESGEADAHQAQGPGAVPERAVEERARELTDPGGIVGTGRKRRRARADREIRIVRATCSLVRRCSASRSDIRRSSSWSRSGSAMSFSKVSSTEIEMRSVAVSS
jgi:hypothetical protein